MAICLRNIKYSFPNFNHQRINNKLCRLSKVSAISHLKYVSATSSSPCDHLVDHYSSLSDLTDRSSPGYGLKATWCKDEVCRSRTKKISRCFSSPSLSPVLRDEEFESNKNVTIFKFPANELWSPPGAFKKEKNLYYSIAFSPLEQKILDDTFRNIPSVSQQDSHLIDKDILDNFKTSPTCCLRLYDVTSILSNKDILNNSFYHYSTDNNESNPDNDLPSYDQLQALNTKLIKELQSIFYKPLDYKIYEPDLVFENKIKGQVVIGLPNYIKKVLLLRVAGHFKFAQVKFEVLGSSMHVEDGIIVIKWRIMGSSGFQMIMTLWKESAVSWGDLHRHGNVWYEGVSTFHVNGKGNVYKHVADNITPEKPPEKVDKVGAALAAIIGLTPGTSNNDTALNMPLGTVITEENDALVNFTLPIEKII